MRTQALPPPGWLVKVVVLHPTVVSSFECFVFESWVLCFRDSGASFSSFGCFVLRSSFSRASFSKLPYTTAKNRKSIKFAYWSIQQLPFYAKINNNNNNNNNNSVIYPRQYL